MKKEDKVFRLMNNVYKQNEVNKAREYKDKNPYEDMEELEIQLDAPMYCYSCKFFHSCELPKGQPFYCLDYEEARDY